MDALENDILTRQEVETIFSRMEEDMNRTVKDELERITKMAGVFVQTLMSNAEGQGAKLEADVNFIENYKALEEIKQFEATDDKPMPPGM